MRRSLVLALVAGLVVGGVIGCGQRARATGADADGMYPSASCAPSVASPAAAAHPTPLPLEGVGRGSLIYRPPGSHAALLLTESGAIYSVPALPDTRTLPAPTLPAPTLPAPAGPASPYGAPVSAPPLDPMFGLRLSPDGRWLSRPDSGGLALRDLTSAVTRHVEAGLADLGAWSDDGRFVVIGRDSAQRLLDLFTGQATPIDLGGRTDWQLDAVFGPHEVLLQQFEPAQGEWNPGLTSHLITIDPADGRLLRTYEMDFGAQRRANAPAVAGHLTVVGSLNHPTDIAVYSLDTGGLVAAFTLPSEDPPQYSFWAVARMAGDRLLAIRDYQYGSPSPRADPVQMFTVDVPSGARTLACTLPAASEYVLRH